MDREKIMGLIKEKGYQKGGTKEACVLAYDYLHNAATIGSSIISHGSGVRNDEFLQAVNVLLLAVRNLPDAIPEQWGCDNDCVYASKEDCPGVFGIKHGSKKTCPYYCTEDK